MTSEELVAQEMMAFSFKARPVPDPSGVGFVGGPPPRPITIP